MNSNKKSPKSPMIRVCLALGLAGTLAACEDLPTPPKKVAPSTVVEAPTPPPPATPMPPAPQVFPEVAKTEPKIEPKVETPEKKLGAFDQVRKLLDDGKTEEGLALAEETAERYPKRSAAWNVLGRAQLKSGKRKSAIESFEKAIELNPKNGYARNNLGLALIYDKRYEDAVDALEEAVECEPVTAFMWNNLGMAYEQLDRLDDARDAYSKAIEMKSDLATASLARLKGVTSVVRTAKVVPDPGRKPDVDVPKEGDTTKVGEDVLPIIR
jgi:tetratricopeptide (TPR) repeat protein